MPTDKQWTINCILFGAKLAKLVSEGMKEHAIREIRNLSSELTEEDAHYLWKRLTKGPE